MVAWVANTLVSSAYRTAGAICVGITATSLWALARSNFHENVVMGIWVDIKSITLREPCNSRNLDVWECSRRIDKHDYSVFVSIKRITKITQLTFKMQGVDIVLGFQA